MMVNYGVAGGANLALQEMPDVPDQKCQIGTSLYIIILRGKILLKKYSVDHFLLFHKNQTTNDQTPTTNDDLEKRGRTTPQIAHFVKPALFQVFAFEKGIKIPSGGK